MHVITAWFWICTCENVDVYVSLRLQCCVSVTGLQLSMRFTVTAFRTHFSWLTGVHTNLRTFIPLILTPSQAEPHTLPNLRPTFCQITARCMFNSRSPWLQLNTNTFQSNHKTCLNGSESVPSLLWSGCGSSAPRCRRSWSWRHHFSTTYKVIQTSFLRQSGAASHLSLS